MIPVASPTLLAATASTWFDVLVVVAVILGIAALIAIPMAIQAVFRQRSKLIEQKFALDSQNRDAVHREREARAYAQNEAINDMAADKLRAEAQLLELQIQLAKRELNSREKADAFNELVMS
ncbi:MAG: hypothetical protein ACK5XO_13370, partial [Phycisphaerales bacterium]